MTVISKIIYDKCSRFRNEYLGLSRDVFTGNNARLTHPGEFGRYRENLVHSLISSFSPTHIRLGDGFIVTSSGEVSTQCDFIAHDGDLCIVRNDANQCFLMSEAIYVIGEVKSVLDRSSFSDAINKLAAQKKIVLDSRNKEYRCQYKHQPLSFLVCEKFDFKYNINDLSEFYTCSPLYQHNMILSLEDGLFTYYIQSKNETTTCHYPAIHDAVICAIRITDIDPIRFISYFVSYIMQHLSSCHRQTAELTNYLAKSTTEHLEFSNTILQKDWKGCL